MRTAAAIIVFVLSGPLSAQWLNSPAPGIPRLPDGKPSRPLPKDPNPSWMGYSIGRWEGDTLVVESSGFVNNNWLDNSGHPGTEAMRLTERFRRRDFGHIDLQLTIDDPKAYTKPWSVNLELTLTPDTELIEYVCNENEKDLGHLVGK
jgi:hypothetical protein